MKKRTLLLLSVAFLALFSGCVDPEATASFDPVTAEEVAERSSINASVRNPEVRQAITEGTSSKTSEGLPDDVTEHGEAIRYNGSYYNVTQEKVGEVEIVAAGIDAQEVNGEANTKLSELSATDRQAAMAAIQAAGHDEDIRVGARYTPNEENNSTLLMEGSVRVSVNGTTYSVTVAERDVRSETVYRYSAREIAPNSSVYGQRLIDRYAFTLENPPKKSSAVLKEAVNSNYYGEETDGFIALRERLQQEEALRSGEWNGVWLVRYNGQLYYAKLTW